MKPLPPKGLIVSCYLESMRGCEREFIASVAHVPGVVALRVEGLDNIRFARRIAPEKFIIGLVKQQCQGKGHLSYTRITASINLGYFIIDAGADMVATDSYMDFLKVGTPYHIMGDMNRSGFEADLGNGLGCAGRIHPVEFVIATTYESKAFGFVKHIKELYPNQLVNLEGGIETAEEVQQGFAAGADYVTIGKAINDPPTIVKGLMKKIVANVKGKYRDVLSTSESFASRKQEQIEAESSAKEVVITRDDLLVDVIRDEVRLQDMSHDQLIAEVKNLRECCGINV